MPDGCRKRSPYSNRPGQGPGNDLVRRSTTSPAISNALGEAYEQAGQFAKAEPLYREALETVRKRHEEASAEAAELQVVLAVNLLKQQRYAEAEPLLRECLKIREQNEPDDWKTFNTKSLLGGSLLGQKKYAEAEPLLLAGYEGMKQREGKIPPSSQGPPDRSHRAAGAALRGLGPAREGRRVEGEAPAGRRRPARRRLRPAVSGPAMSRVPRTALDRPMNPRSPAAGG